jgi:hypothetical protein
VFWLWAGFIGAVLLRGAMIAAGARAVAEFHGIWYFFGIFLILTGFRMLFLKADPKDPNQNIVVRLARRWLPITTSYHGEHFLVRAGSPASPTALRDLQPDARRGNQNARDDQDQGPAQRVPVNGSRQKHPQETQSAERRREAEPR